MSTVQISYNSILMKPQEVNPLAQPSAQYPALKSKEQNKKEQAHSTTDTVTISREAAAKAAESRIAGETSDRNVADEIRVPSQQRHLQLVINSPDPSEDVPPVSDTVNISQQATLKVSIFKALSEAA